MTRLIRFVCGAIDHQQLALFVSGSASAPNPLTYRDGAWAYCPRGTVDGHDWQQIPEREFEGLRTETERMISAGGASATS